MRSTVGIPLLPAQAVAVGQGGGGCQGLIYPDTDVRGRSVHNSYVVFEPAQLRVIRLDLDIEQEKYERLRG